MTTHIVLDLFLPLDEAVASRAVFVICIRVGRADGRTGGFWSQLKVRLHVQFLLAIILDSGRNF